MKQADGLPVNVNVESTKACFNISQAQDTPSQEEMQLMNKYNTIDVNNSQSAVHIKYNEKKLAHENPVVQSERPAQQKADFLT